MAVPSVAPVIADGVPGQQAPHDGSHRIGARPQQHMEMIGNQRPGIAGRPGLLQDIAELRQKVISILVIIKYLAALNPAHDDVVQSAECVYTGFSWHCQSHIRHLVQCQIYMFRAAQILPYVKEPLQRIIFRLFR